MFVRSERAWQGEALPREGRRGLAARGEAAWRGPRSGPSEERAPQARAARVAAGDSGRPKAAGPCLVFL